MSYKGIFYVMSLSIGDSWIRTSITGSLNTIRDDEQEAKGWKKGERALPYEFQDLDAVHILPFVDLGRLLIVLVTRSIALSNTQYSLLLENEGRLVNLGSEWIGAKIENLFRHYDNRRLTCYSGMLAPDDFDFTDYWGYNNDECEYFINGFVTDDRIYLQSTVFETTFELEMNFDLIELEFNQLNETGMVFVTSNPYFAFHDDVFPSFAKNQVTQGKFHPSVADKVTLIPDNHFTSLAYFDHISSIILDPIYDIIAISFDLKMMNDKNQSWKNMLTSSLKILEFRLSSGENLLTVEIVTKGGIQFSSFFLDEKIISRKNIFAKEQSFLIKFYLNDFLGRFISLFDPDQEEYDRMRLRKKITNFVNFNRQTVQIYKHGNEMAIKKLCYSSYFQNEIFNDHLLLLFDGSSYSSMTSYKTSYVISGGDKDIYNSIRNYPLLFSPAERGYTINAISTVYKDRLHIFGGINDGLKVYLLEFY